MKKLSWTNWVPVLFLALAFLFFWEVWFQGLSIQGIDDNYSMRLLLKRSMGAFSDSTWNPTYWLGFGGVRSVHTRMLFFSLFPEQWNLAVCLTFSMFSAMTGMYCFLRRYELGALPAVFGAAAYGFAPHFITLVYPCHIDTICQMAFTPWLFYFLSHTFGRQASGWKTILAALTAGAFWGMVQNDDVQRGLYFSVFAAGYSLFLIVEQLKADEARMKSARGIAVRVVLVAVMFLSIFANNLVKQLGGARVKGKQAGVSESGAKVESEKWAFATGWSLNPKELADSLAPGYHGMTTGDPERPYWGERPIAHSNDSLGFFVVIFGLAGLAASFRTSGAVRFFALSALLATLLAFGGYMPGKPLFWLWYHLPMMDKMRAPVKFMSVTVFALSVLSAFGFRSLYLAVTEQNRKVLLAWLYGFGGLLAVGVFWLIGVSAGGNTIVEAAAPRVGAQAAEAAQAGAVKAVTAMVCFALAGSGLSAAAVWGPKKQAVLRWLPVGFILLLLLDLVSIDRFYFKRSLFDPDAFYRGDDIISFLEQDTEPHRVCTTLKIMHQGRMAPLSLMANGGMYITHLFPYFGIESMDSIPRSRVPRDYSSFFEQHLSGFPQERAPLQIVEKLVDQQLDLWRLGNVKYVLTDGFLYGISQQPLQVFETLKAHPALELCHVGNDLSGRQTAVFRVKQFLPRAAVYSDADVLNSAYTAAEIVEQRPGYVRLKTSPAEASVLVWSSRFHKGWQAEAGGKDLEPFAVEGALTGLHIPAGPQEIELTFAPKSAARKLSSFAVVSGLVLLCAWAAVSLRKAKER